MYETGKGIEQNSEEAVKWYRKAAEQENATAQYNLGLIYQYGKGVVKNHSEAIKWYEKSAGHGYQSAEKKLKTLKP